MTTAAAQIQFAAEFVTFLVAAAGLALVVLRNDLTTNRPAERLALAIGFLATGCAAFGHGSLLLKGDSTGVVVGLRIAGIAGLAVGSIWWWRGGAVARRLMWLGLVVMVGAVAFQITGGGRASDVLLAGGSIVIGAALVIASRRSVSARVAASAAGTLLLVVLVLSVALSAVLSSSTEREELSRLQARANTETSLATSGFIKNEVQTTRIVADFLYGTDLGDLVVLAQAANVSIANVAPSANTPTAAVDNVANLLKLLGADLKDVGGFAYLDPHAHILARSKGVDPTTLTELSGTQLVQQAACPQLDQGSIEPVRNQVLSLAVAPVCVGPGQTAFIGTVVRVNPLNDSYLAQRQAGDPTSTLAIVSPLGVAARSGANPPPRVLIAAGQPVLDGGAQVSRVVGSYYLAVQPIQGSDHKTIAALIVSAPTSVVFGTRDRLFRTLFLIALGGTLLALGLAVLIGDRITAGLRRLTMAAEGIQRGDVGVRSGISSDDEVGVLGAAFDSMADSIERQTTALQSAADDETRLRNRLEAVVAGMGDALIAVDGRGRVTDFNNAAEELTGISADRAVGRAVDEVVMLVNEEGGSLGIRLRTPSPSRWGMLATAVHTSGEEIPIAVSAGALRGPHNDLAGQVLVVRDLRRERQVERMKSEFLNRIGHELRTPLTGIMGYADILLRRSASPEQAQLSHEEILSSAKRLLRTVEMLEFFASSGAGRVLMRPEPLDVRQLIEGVVATWSERLQAPSAISRRVARRLPAVIGDRRWLALAIDELIENAVKFSPGGAQVTVTAATTTASLRPAGTQAAHNGAGVEETPPAAVEISVIDRGKGMTPEEQLTAFSEFVQGDSSDTRRYGGLGLGLSLVQRVVEGHGGTVRCTSTPGQGSTFTIVLPVAPVEPGSGDGPGPKSVGPPGPTRPPRPSLSERRATRTPA